MSRDEITVLARDLGRACKRRRMMVATAESCTGGGVAEAITRISGSSAWFDRAFVTYTNTAKKEMLGVAQKTLARHGAVSRETAREMVQGALAFSHADAAVAVTGIAGPTGGTLAKPVGLVYVAWALRGGAARVRQFRFRGDREDIRAESVIQAIQGLIAAISARA
jgi:nicotinamide-nucleotide amidase